jgi:hypothetical protein
LALAEAVAGAGLRPGRESPLKPRPWGEGSLRVPIGFSDQPDWRDRACRAWQPAHDISIIALLFRYSKSLVPRDADDI